LVLSSSVILFEGFGYGYMKWEAGKRPVGDVI